MTKQSVNAKIGSGKTCVTIPSGFPKDTVKLLAKAHLDKSELLELAGVKLKPIGQAPKDGRDVIVYCEDTAEYFCAGFMTSTVDNGNWVYAKTQLKNGAIRELYCHPTHYLNLPLSALEPEVCDD